MTHSARFSKSNEWETGWQGAIHVRVGSTVEGGWTVVLNFNTPVDRFELKVANADIRSKDRNSILLENSSHNPALWPDQQVTIEIVVSHPVALAAPKLDSAEFEGVDVEMT